VPSARTRAGANDASRVGALLAGLPWRALWLGVQIAADGGGRYVGDLIHVGPVASFPTSHRLGRYAMTTIASTSSSSTTLTWSIQSMLRLPGFSAGTGASPATPTPWTSASRRQLAPAPATAVLHALGPRR
jgi:hypothetical protein